MTRLVARSRRFWLDLWNDRDIDAMRAEFHPEYVQVDHRALNVNGPSQAEWEQLIRTWWELTPDITAVEHETLAEASDRLAFFLLFRGHDTVSGGTFELSMCVVVGMRDDLFATADLFDDRDAALAFFAERAEVNQPPRAGDAKLPAAFRAPRGT